MKQFIFTLALMLTLSASSMQARMHHKQQPQATETMVADTAAGLEAVSDTAGSLDENSEPDAVVDTAAVDDYYNSDHDYFNKTIGNFLYHNTWVLVLLAIAAVVLILLMIALPIIILVMILRWLIGNHNKKVDAEWAEHYQQPTTPYATQPQPTQQQEQAQTAGQPLADAQQEQPQPVQQPGQPLAEEMEAQAAAQQVQFDQSQQQAQQQTSPDVDAATRVYLNKQWQKGVRNTALGVGLIFLFLCIGAEQLAGIGILVACCGVGQMAIAKWPSYKSGLKDTSSDPHQHVGNEGQRR